MKNFWQRTIEYIKSHKRTSVIIAIIILAAGYGLTKAFGTSSTETRYILATAEKGTIMSTISGTGQVSASNQIDIKSRASGDITAVNVKTGDPVVAGQIIAQIDARNALLDLENAQISLAKLTKPADALSQAQTQNAVTAAREAQAQSYDQAASTIAKSFVDVPNILSGLNDLLNSYQVGVGYLNDNNARAYGGKTIDYQIEANQSLGQAKAAYETAFAAYKDYAATKATSSLPNLINQVYAMSQSASAAVKKTKDTFDYSQQLNIQSSQRSDTTAIQNNLSSWTTTINNDQANLLSDKNSLESSARTINEKNEALIKLEQGTDPLDIRSQQLALQQRQYAYADYFIRAPFDGVIGKMSIHNNDSVSSGAIAATIVSRQKVADISLNEVDAAKIKVGNKVSVTFDAIDDLTIAGQVSEVDLVGTVSQGVVTYNVKITFDTQDERIRSGMSVSASIITDMKNDVLIIPNGAIKNQNGNSYVQVVTEQSSATSTTDVTGVALSTPPESRPVEVGLTNDTDTEIISGLREGEQIVARTITAAKTTTAAAPSLFGSGNTRAAGGTRAITR